MKKKSKFLSLSSPIPEPPDVYQLQKNLREFGIVPYFGENPGYSLLILDLIKTACELSPVYVSTMRDINTFCFGAYSEIGRVPVPGLKMKRVDLSEADQVKFGLELAKYGLSLESIIQVMKKINRHLSDSGNGYLRIKRVTVAGVVRYRLFADHYLNCAYLVPAKGEEGRKFLLISPYLTNPAKMKETKDYKILEAVEPGEELIWKKTGRNTEEAVVHIKNEDGADREGYYGRSAQISCLMSLYVDYYTILRLAKIAKTDLISKKIVTMEGAEPGMGDQEQYPEPDFEDGELDARPKKQISTFDKNVIALKEITTNLGEGDMASSLGVIEFPFGTQQPGTIDMEVNRDTAFDTFSTDKATRQITSVNGWAPELVGLSATKSGIGGNVLKDLFLVKRASTVLPLQVFWQSIINGILGQLPELGGQNLGVVFSDNVNELIADLSKEVGMNEGADVNVTI